MKPTIEQKALIAASKPGIDLLLEELRRSHEFFHVPSHLCWNTPGACGCFDCFATRGACFNAGWHHEGERGGKVERHRAEGTLAHAGTGKVHMLPGDLVDSHLLLFVCYPILYFMSRFRRGNPCQH